MQLFLILNVYSMHHTHAHTWLQHGTPRGENKYKAYSILIETERRLPTSYIHLAIIIFQRNGESLCA